MNAQDVRDVVEVALVEIGRGEGFTGVESIARRGLTASTESMVADIVAMCDADCTLGEAFAAVVAECKRLVQQDQGENGPHPAG